MITRKFKVFETINNFKKLYEAATEEVEQAQDEQQVEDPSVQSGADATQSPSENVRDAAVAEQEAAQKTELAQMLLKALMSAPPEDRSVLFDMMNMGTNDSEIIKYIQKLNMTNQPMAKVMFEALMSEPPEPGAIPSNLMEVTPENVDQIISYIQNLTAVSSPLSLENDEDKNTLAGALKEI